MSFLYLILLGCVMDAVFCDMAATEVNIPEDGRLDFIGLTAKYGRQAIAHDVVTKDGYILTLFNLPGNKKEPLLLVHGVFDTSSGFFIRGNNSVGMMASHKGYDVWAMNFRGNRYSRKHRTMDPDIDPKFWDYSAHEFGTYDLPACIDYVLNATKQKQLSMIGFSEGTTAAFILGSTQQEYNDKIKIFIAMAPIAYLQNVRPNLSIIIQISPFLDYFLPQSVQEIAGHNSMTKAVINIVCTQLPISYELCYLGGMNSVSGKDSAGIEREFLPVVIGHFPSGTSRKNLIHYAQISLKSRFAPYDYGTLKNWDVYRAFTPPEYNMTKMTAKTILVSGKNDPVSTLDDMEILKKALPNVQKHIVIEKEAYNHLDHMFGKDSYIVEYPQLFDELAKY